MPVVELTVTRPPAENANPRTPELVPPLFRGRGGTDYVCGNCGAVIASGMGPDQHVIIDRTVCAGCGAENEFPPSLRA